MTDLKLLPPLIDVSLFQSAISKGTTILVPNQRLVDNINQAWSQIQTYQAWETPLIFTVKTWLRICWDHLKDMHHSEATEFSIVSEEHYKYLWYKAIQLHDPELATTYVDLASDTENNIETWQLNSIAVNNEHYGSIRFSRWRGTFHELLKSKKIVTQAHSWSIIMKSFKQGYLPPLPAISLYGFQAISPLEFDTISAASEVLSSIDQSLVTIDMVRSARSSRNSISNFTLQGEKLDFTKAAKVRCGDQYNELTSSALWAAEQLKINQNQRIAIVVPDLVSRLGEISRVINKIFIAKGIKSTVNFSAGIPLISAPIISAAIDLLSIVGEEKSSTKWLQIIHSPFNTFGQLESGLKIKLENKLIELRQFKIPVWKFLKLINSSVDPSHNSYFNLANVIKKIERKEKNNSKMNFSNWATFFTDILEGLGWPGGRPLSSIEYQQRKQFFITLEAFSKFDNLNIKTYFGEAKTTLEAMLANHIFHPQSPDAPLQVLGLLEASGLRFDSIWVLGLQSKVFPRPTKSNPLLPPSYLRRHGFPGSLPEVEYTIARCLLENYHSNCNSLFLSYPGISDDEILRECSLLQEVKFIETIKITNINEQITTIRRKNYEDSCESYTQINVPLRDSEMHVRGGIAVLRDQSACPVNAFITHRLNIAYPIKPVQGLDNAQRGILIHDTMSNIWNTLRCSMALAKKTNLELNIEIDRAITTTFSKYVVQFQALRSKNLYELEKNRLEKLIKDWLILETKRSPFQVIDIEKKTEIKLGALSFSIVIDRIDRIKQRLFVVDYKTGKLAQTNWNADRLLDPQLPVYVLSVEPHAGALAYAHIKPGDLKWVGQSDINLDMGLEEIDYWSDRLISWKEKLMSLANEFAAGEISFIIHDKNRFMQQKYLFPINRWPEIFLTKTPDGNF